MKKLLIFFLIGLCNVINVKCLYEDQAGTYDWRQQYVGKPLFSHVDYGSKKFYVATDQNLLSSLNIKNGNIAWRKIFESNSNGKIDFVLWGSKEILVITGNGKRIQSFNYNNGFANWEYILFSSGLDLNNKITGIESKRDSESFYFINGNQLCLVGFQEKACVDIPSDDGYIYKNIYETSKGVFVIGIKDNFIQKIQYNFKLSSVLSKTFPSNNGHLEWITSKTDCSKLIDSDQFYCVSNEAKQVFLSSLRTEQFEFEEITLPVELLADKDFSTARLAWANSNTYILELNKIETSKDDYKNIQLLLLKLDSNNNFFLHKTIESVANYNFKQKDNENYLVYAKYNDLNALQFSVLSLTNDKKTEHVVNVVSTPSDPKAILQINSNLIEGKSGQLGLVAFCFFADYSMSVFNSQGVKYFTREEGLAYISAVEMIDFPLLHLQEEFEDEFGTSKEDNIISMFFKRIRSQIFQLQEFIFIDLYQKLTKLITTGNPNKRAINSKPGVAQNQLTVEEIVRDEFNLNKLIVVATTIGKVFGIYSSANGQILWSFYLKNTKPFELTNKATNKKSVALFLQRTAAHFPHEPQSVLISKYETNKNDDSKTLVFYFNPLTGQPSKDYPTTGVILDYPIKQAFLSNTANEASFLKPLVLLDDQLKLHVFPKSSSDALTKNANKLNVIYLADVMDEKNSVLVGYGIKQVEQPLPELWRINIEDETIVAIGSKLPNDHVHSHGKVLGDRSVLYKYLNPGLIGVVTSGLDGQSNPFINVYLIDTVTGSIVNSFNHKRCKGPVNIVHSENWFFYSYYNIKYRRFEVTSVELFEGSNQFNSTHFSSLDDIKPIFYSKSYIVQKAFDSMQVTLTEKGITTKDIIVACQSGIIIEIPWVLIEPRRPVKMTEVEREENLLPYMPEIPLNYEFSLNYYNYVYNIRGITTAPSGLESTSLVFVYGLDVYFTRVFPSKTFDMLREDFDYFFIITLMIGLLLGTFLSKKLASSSNLKKAWK